MPQFSVPHASHAGVATGDLVPKLARTVSGASAWVDVGNVRSLVAQLDSAAGTGTTPTLAVKVQTSPDGTDARAVDVPNGAFANVAAAASAQLIKVEPIHAFVRVVWTITGTTPSFDFGVYATGRT